MIESIACSQCMVVVNEPSNGVDGINYANYFIYF